MLMYFGEKLNQIEIICESCFILSQVINCFHNNLIELIQNCLKCCMKLQITRESQKISQMKHID